MDDLFDSEMPEPHFATLPANKMANPPERTLALAVMNAAIADLLKNRSRRGHDAAKLYREAAQWIGSDDETWPYSFVNLCGLLDLPAAAMRRQLLTEAETAALAA